MEPPLLPNPPISTTITTPQPPPPQQTSLDSNNSSSWDDQSQQPSQQQKIRLMCSYGGHIIPRPHDKSLCYVGGDTRIFVTNRNTSLTELSARLSKNLLSNRPFWLKYQLPNEDLDSLISVTTDEDLENMIDEYERVAKSSRIRVFLFTSHEFDNSAVSSIGSLLQSSTKSEDWFVHALNNGAVAAANSASTTTNKVFSESSSVNCLLGLDDDVGKLDGSFGGAKNVQINPQDVQSVPDSPMVETTSSFGSTNSTPSLTNLPPIKVHVEENNNNNNNQRVGIEEQFSQLGVKTVTSPAVPVTGTVSSGVPVVVGGGDYVNRVYSDDERSDQGVGVGYRNNNTVQMQQQQLQQQPQQLQPKPIVVPSDLPSPNSVSSESSVTNPLSGQRHFFYQEQGVQIQSGNNRVSPNSIEMKHHSDPNNRAQVQQQQVQEAAGYALPVQYDQQQQQQMYHQPQQQYVHASQYIHHTPSGPVPMASYYPIYHSQQQQQQQTHPLQHPGLEQHQYPVYFVHSRQPSQAYNLPVQQTNYSESAQTIASNQPQTPPASSMARNAPASKPEMTAGTYRTAAAAAPQLVQIPPGQHQHQHQQQYVGYSQIHHPSQPIPPTSAATANYAYEQIYYSQAHAPQFSAQYQTMTSHNNSSQLPTENNQPTS